MSNLKQAITKQKSKDQSIYPIIQIGYMKRVGDATICENYGIHGNPPAGTPCLMITVNNDEANRYVIPLSALQRTKGLEENEFECGNMVAESLITFDKDGNIDITSQLANITVNSIVGNITATALIGKITATAPVNGVEVNAPLTTINGNVLINGAISVTGVAGTPSTIAGAVTSTATIDNQGAVSGTGNIESNGIGLDDHKHTDVTVGTGNTGGPTP